jgi:hypothetical protein
MPKRAIRRHVPKIFISYAAVDKVLVHKIRNVLEISVDASISTDEDLSAGGDWMSQLRQAIEDSDYMVAVLTPQSVRSAFVVPEISAAWALGKPIIPLVTRRQILNAVPIAMDESQTIILPDLDDPAAAEELGKRFSQIIGLHSVQS